MSPFKPVVLKGVFKQTMISRQLVSPLPPVAGGLIHSSQHMTELKETAQVLVVAEINEHWCGWSPWEKSHCSGSSQ